MIADILSTIAHTDQEMHTRLLAAGYTYLGDGMYRGPEGMDQQDMLKDLIQHHDFVMAYGGYIDEAL